MSVRQNVRSAKRPFGKMTVGKMSVRQNVFRQSVFRQNVRVPHGFIREDLLQEHEPHCCRHGAQRIELPNEDNASLYFKDYHKQLKVPFVIYADFESITVKIDSVSPNPTKSSTEKYQHHQPCGFSYVVVSEAEKYNKPPVVYRRDDAVGKFLECLETEQQYIDEKVSFIEPMRIEREEEQIFQDAINCHICGFELGADRVRDHCHLIGKYRGAAHNECNLNYSFTGRIPIILHNLRGYDSHLIMQGLGKLKNKEINCIHNNTEKCISFSIDKLDFIDSLQFMNASLERLVSNLSKSGVDMFPTLQKHTEADKLPLLLRKGVYPYDYMDSFEKFDEETLPRQECFYSVLNDENISDADYDHAARVFDAFSCQNMGDYHDLYLKSDVLLLADVFENFRNVCLKAYNLDPCHFYTSPGLAWQACLKMTEVEVELLTDPDMYLFVEEGLRGGISMISSRFSRANNPYVPDYDPDQETSYVMYLDANNLTRIHRVLVFQQNPWLKAYIDFNTERRKCAANDFEKYE